MQNIFWNAHFFKNASFPCTFCILMFTLCILFKLYPADTTVNTKLPKQMSFLLVYIYPKQMSFLLVYIFFTVLFNTASYKTYTNFTAFFMKRSLSMFILNSFIGFGFTRTLFSRFFHFLWVASFRRTRTRMGILLLSYTFFKLENFKSNTF